MGMFSRESRRSEGLSLPAVSITNAASASFVEMLQSPLTLQLLQSVLILNCAKSGHVTTVADESTSTTKIPATNITKELLENS